jgi:hypothetical protein
MGISQSIFGLDEKQRWVLSISTTMTAIVAYYFIPGANTLTTAIWYGFCNGLIDLGAFVLVDYFV